jgi:hypothetical protein
VREGKSTAPAIFRRATAMFQHLIEYPLPVVFDGGLIVCVDVTITLEIEPTFRGSREWQISRMWIWGNRKVGPLIADNADDHEIPSRDPMFKAIAKYAEQRCEIGISEKWDEWIASKSERIADARRA